MHFKSLEDELHLLLGQSLIRELLQQLTQVVQGNLILGLDDLAREQLPFLPRNLLRDGIEQVDRGVFDHFLMEGTVGGFVVVKSVLPTALVLAGLILAVSDVLPEVDCLLGRHIEANSIAHIVKGQLAILIFI